MNNDRNQSEELTTSPDLTYQKACELIFPSLNAPGDPWKSKGLGLQLSLLNFAEIQSKRIKTLFTNVEKLEIDLFTEESFNTLSIPQKLNLYKLVTQSLSESSKFVGSVLKEFNWDELTNEIKLLEFNELESTNPSKYEEIKTKISGKILELVLEQSYIKKIGSEDVIDVK